MNPRIRLLCFIRTLSKEGEKKNKIRKIHKKNKEHFPGKIQSQFFPVTFLKIMKKKKKPRRYNNETNTNILYPFSNFTIMKPSRKYLSIEIQIHIIGVFGILYFKKLRMAR